MKKILSIASAVMLLVTVSCTGNSESSQSSINEPKFTEDGKPVITVGNFGYSDPLFSDYLNAPADMEIELVNYAQNTDNSLSPNDRINAAHRELDMALISGNAPDIILADPDEISRLNRQGALTDLFSLMEKYDGIKKEDFTDCALEGLTVDGKFPAIMENYYIYTAAAKTKFVGKEYENWNAGDAISFYNSLTDGKNFWNADSETALADYMLKIEGMNCIDMKANTCDFSGAFTELLDFCKQNPVKVKSNPDFSQMDNGDWYFFQQEELCGGLNDVQLVYPIIINGFNFSLAQKTFCYFNEEDITFVGYPSENGCGAYIQPAEALIGICGQSGNKEAAWELVNRMIRHRDHPSEIMNSDVMGIPVFKSELEWYYNLPDNYASSINSENYKYNGTSDEAVNIPQEYKDMLYDYILSVPANPYTPQSLSYIIEEEYEQVIHDSRTAKEAADILQNRIETYLSERS